MVLMVLMVLLVHEVLLILVDPTNLMVLAI